MNIYIVNNIWEIFISSLLIQKHKKESLLLVNINNLDKKIIENLKRNYTIITYNFSMNILDKGFKYWIRKKVIIPKLLKNINLNSKEIIINSFSDQDIMTRYFLDCNIEVNLYEHGIINYQENFNSITQKIKKYIFRMEKPYGRDKRVKNIYLKFPEKAPADIKEKTLKLDLDNLIDKLDDIQKIKNIYEVEGIEKIEKGEIWLVTQPLSEDKIISEEEKLELYKKILEKYKEKNILIKPHPREITNYTSFIEKIAMNNVDIMNNCYPLELLKVLKIRPQKVVTIFSSAVLDYKEDTEIDFYGTEVHPKLLERFGSMDHIIKRNCYL